MSTCYPPGAYGAGITLANAFWDQVYGAAGVDFGGLVNSYIGAASGVVPSGNPPYPVTNLLAIYPKFFGPATTFTGTTVAPIQVRTAIAQGSSGLAVDDATGIDVGYMVSGIGIPEGAVVQSVSGLQVMISVQAETNATISATFSNPATYETISGISSTTGMAVGQLVVGPGIAPGAVITSVSQNSVNVSLPNVANASAATMSSYAQPFVPLLVLQLYINLALASLMSARWMEAWSLAMALYVAHFATLWLKTESGPNSTAAQIANSGLQVGVVVSQSAGDVSASLKPLEGFDGWGTLNLTSYGMQLATMAQSIGSGPIYVGSSVGRYPGAF